MAMPTTTMPEARVIDPVCGMMIDPETAAGKSTRNGQTYYFCSPGCRAQFDAGASVPHTQAAEELTHTHAGVEAEVAQERAYRTMMTKFWFAAIIGIPVLLTMLTDVIPALRDALMPWHQVCDHRGSGWECDIFQESQARSG